MLLPSLALPSAKLAMPVPPWMACASANSTGRCAAQEKGAEHRKNNFADFAMMAARCDGAPPKEVQREHV